VAADAIKLFEYPSSKSKDRDRILVTKPDYKRLEPGEFFNDTLVDFFLKLLMTDAVERVAARPFERVAH
jgi:Ulp1 family protease